MKTFTYLCLFFFIATSCNKKHTVNPIDQLPPLTTEGKNTFGCLIDGKVFKPKGALFGPPSRSSSYQYIHNKGNSYYNFQVSAANSPEPFESIYINVQFQNFEDLQRNKVYSLGKIGTNNGGGGYFTGGQETYETDLINQGSITITHYDYPNRIVSGTFEFQVEMNGKIVRITDGRFDMKFSI